MARRRQNNRTIELIIVVQAAFASQANNRVGEDVFTSALSANGSLPASHYWCAWRMTPAQDSSLRGQLASLVAGNRARIFNGLQNTPEEVLSQIGLQRVKFPVV